ncbi:MAG: DUF58 domain-containing protein [Elusimicrobia bacterium]|nr:DUF58 domain-containing protein [Elusimicrobiota bacterium]
MISREILSQVRRIEILTGRLVSETFAGEYQSVFKGRGMEFQEVREYSPGDDIRAIDWNVTARTGRPFVRQYTEERELTVAVACDLSGSQYFGSAQRLKNETAAELSAVLAFSALQNNDKVGLFLFTDEIEEYVPPKKGRRHVLHLIRDVLAFAPERRGTRIQAALDRINRVLKRRCILFLISDFRDQGFEKSLKMAALKHDVVPVLIRDPLEASLPRVNAVLNLQDPESGERALWDAGREDLRESHAGLESARIKSLKQTFRLYGLDDIEIGTDRSYIEPVIRFFRERQKRLRH